MKSDTRVGTDIEKCPDKLTVVDQVLFHSSRLSLLSLAQIIVCVS